MPSPSEHLHALIREQGGMISVERFMQEALYHPVYGYYANRVRGIGARGDFSTSATLHPALPQAIAAWAVKHRAEVAQSGSWHVIELGGGGGQMAEGVLQTAGWFRRLGLHYHIVDVSNPLRALQEKRLAGFRQLVHWHPDITGALDAAKGRALIFSNEFVDAFPCIQLIRNEEASQPWSEVMVAWPEESPYPVEKFAPWQNPAANPAESSVLSQEYEWSVRAGQRVEIHRAYQSWLDQWLPRWYGGRMLTVDYGDLLPDLYFRRPGGTLRAYVRHQRTTGPQIYENIGQQDLTADVNFTDLKAWGSRSGLLVSGFHTQSQFLRLWIGEKRVNQAAKRDPALAFLTDDAGAGSAFKVIEQSRGAMGKPVGLLS